MKPLNDLAKIRLDKDEFGFGGELESAESGILEALPEKLFYFGMWSFAFENSFMARKELDELLDHWKTKLGQRVYWTALSEKGNVIEKDDERFAYVKLTSLICEDDPEAQGQNVHGNGEGSFKV